MSTAGKALLLDGSQAILKGVNSGIAPNVVPRDQLAWMVNGQTRSDFPAQRPGWTRRVLGGESIPTGLFQGAGIFGYANKLVLSVSGMIYAIDLSSYEVQALTANALPSSLPLRNSSTLRRAWFCEAENFLIIQDGQSAALIYDGAMARRSNPAQREVPTGTCMAYALGRLWVTLPDGRSYVGSDLVYGSSGTAAYGRRDAILKFTENTLLLGGGAFGVPFRVGRINAMVPIAQLDTSLGQGPLQVFCDIGAFSVNAPFDRTTWQNVTFPIQSSSLLGYGALSDWSSVNVNGDIWYRSQDGVRSFQVARRNHGSWTNTALSHEVERALSSDQRDQLLWSSAALFDNRLLITTHPYSSFDYGTLHRGLAVLDFSPSTSILLQDPPVWEGEWSGLQILQVLSGTINGQERAFILALDSSNLIQLWELSLDSLYDNDGEVDRLVTWELETGSWNWKDKGWSLKQLEWGAAWYDQIADDLAFTLYYKPDQDPAWHLWHSWQSCAIHHSCSNVADPATGCGPTPATLGTQYRVRHRYPQLDNRDCDLSVGKPRRHGYEFAQRLVIQGPCRIKKMFLVATDVPEPAIGACDNDQVCKTVEACVPDTLSFDSAAAPARG